MSFWADTLQKVGIPEIFINYLNQFGSLNITSLKDLIKLNNVTFWLQLMTKCVGLPIP